jgi:cytochrome b561
LTFALASVALPLRYGAPLLGADLPESMKLAAVGWHCRRRPHVPSFYSERGIFQWFLPQSDNLHKLLWDGHFYLAFPFFGLILLHVAAALFHALVRRDGVFEKMASVMTSDEVAPAE